VAETRDRLELDYTETLATHRQLAEIRFKLLAFVPTLSGIFVGLLTSARLDGWEQVGLAALGFVVTVGIVLYDRRNTQFYNGAISRAQHLEQQLELDKFEGDENVGLFGSRKDHRKRRLFGLPVRHDLGLDLIYGAVLGAWVFAAVAAADNAGLALSAGLAVATAFVVTEQWSELRKLAGGASRGRRRRVPPLRL
jgi:hypothetical protein